MKINLNYITFVVIFIIFIKFMTYNFWVTDSFILIIIINILIYYRLKRYYFN